MVLEARRSAETGELRRLEVRAAAELQALSAGEAAQLQEQFADTRFRCGAPAAAVGHSAAALCNCSPAGCSQ